MPNPRFDLTTLRVFAAVAELRSISKAAERERIAVSAASKRVSDLEAALGTQLLHRLPRGVEPTPAGSALLHHATVVLRSLEQLEGDLSEYARGVKGHLRMMVNKSSIVDTLPEELSAFVREYPDIKIDLREENSTDIVRGVADGLADIGVFAAGLALPGKLEIYPYRTHKLVLVAPLGHPLASRSRVRLDDVLDHDFVGLHVGSAWDVLLAEATAGLDRPLRLRCRVASFDAVCRMIGAKLGVGLVPPAVLGAFTSAAGLVAVPFDEAWAERRLMVCVRDLAASPVSARLMVRHLTRDARTEAA